MNDELNEGHNGNGNPSLKEHAENLRQKVMEMEEQVTENLNSFMSSTAENLDKAAEKMHGTADFFREKNATMFKENLSHAVKKKPAYAFGGALIVGFLIGRILSR